MDRDGECSLRDDTVCYLCSILDEETKAERGILADSPAATKKVFDVSLALKSRVKRTYVLSLGRGKQSGKKKQYAATVKRISSLPVLYACFSPFLFLTYIVSSCSLIPLMLRIRKKNKGRIHVIAYNRQWLYLPVLLVSRLFRMRCYLDLEDSALVEDVGLVKSFLIKLNVSIFDNLCSHGSILVNSRLLEQVKTTNNVICYGVASKLADVEKTHWSGQKVHFLFGGSLLSDTGVTLLIDAVKILNLEYLNYKGRFVIDVTGYGDMSDDLKLLSEEEGAGWLVYYGRVSLKRYNTLLLQSHAGLCLKLPSSEMSAQTFPSKTIEIASFGKLLVTTELEDVSALFSRDGACYITEENGRLLAEMFTTVVDNPDASIQTAMIGQQRLLKTCNSKRVADDICCLLKGL